jgi:ABC-2 type transport system ATP-binding protein
MDEAEVLCDRVAILDHGRLLRLDSPAALVEDLDAPVRVTESRGTLEDVFLSLTGREYRA